jgi:hypothetical protein
MIFYELPGTGNTLTVQTFIGLPRCAKLGNYASALSAAQIWFVELDQRAQPQK